MSKRRWILASTGVLLACLLVQNVQAAASSVGFSQGSMFVWRWTNYTYNTDMTVKDTTVRYKLMNVTSLVTGTDHLNISAKYPYANQSDYEANGIAGSHWSGSGTYSSQVLDNNSTYWFQGFYCKSGVTMLNLLTMGANDQYTAFGNMHAVTVSEMLGVYLGMAFAQMFNPSTFWSTTSASISLALISYVSGTINIAFGYQSSGHWTNSTVKITSSFTYSVLSLMLSSMDSTFEMSTVSWNNSLATYQTETARSRHVYAAVYPADLANYIAIEWFIGGGVGVLLVVVIASAIHKHKKTAGK
jgi:hypothetical protein